jgi:hypothetical protein
MGFSSLNPSYELRCAPLSARLKGWCSTLCSWPSFEARKMRAPQDDGELVTNPHAAFAVFSAGAACSMARM